MSREFRDVLKMAKPELTDAIMKLPRSARKKEMKTQQTMKPDEIILPRPVLIMTRGEEEEGDTSWEA